MILLQIVTIFPTNNTYHDGDKFAFSTAYMAYSKQKHDIGQQHTYYPAIIANLNMTKIPKKIRTYSFQ